MRHLSKLLYLVDKHIDHWGIQKALELASTHQAELTVLDVVPELKLRSSWAEALGGNKALTENIASARSKAIEHALATLPGGKTAVVSAASGRRYLEAIYAVLRDDYDLVIKLAEEPAWAGRFVSSDDMHLLRKCPCPVWMIQEKPPAEEAVVLAAVDFDPDVVEPEQQELNRKILSFASLIATFASAQLHIFHAWESPVAGFASLWSDMPEESEKRILDGEYAVRRDLMTACDLELKEMLGDDTYEFLSPRTRLIHGTPEEHIPGYAEKIGADIVVMGTVGRTGIPGLIIGNTAEDVLQQLRCSIVAVKPNGFCSPVTLP